jgi:ribonucleotide reductase alpha subunit
VADRYNIATAERLYSENPREQHMEMARQFYGTMARQEFVANTPTMLNAGKPKQQLSACFVLPVEDDLDGILNSAMDMARIHKSGGGTGFSFSRLRPKGDIIASGGTTTGPIAFMQAYNDITSQIRQGGVRRGANMGILHYNHPDILLFAVYKVDEFSLTNFNISVTVDEAFFEAVKRDAAALPANYEDDFPFEELIAEIKEAHRTRDLDLKLVRLDAAVAKLARMGRREGPEPRLRPDQPAQRQRSRPAQRQEGVRPDHAPGLAVRRPGHDHDRPHQQLPRQPDAAAGHDRGHQPVRRAAAAALRRLYARPD